MPNKPGTPRQFEEHPLEHPNLPFRFVARSVAAPNRHTPLNWHENIELLFFLSGEGTVLYGNSKIPVRAGDTVIVNTNVLHAVTGSASTPCRFHYLILYRAFALENGIDTSRIRFLERVRDDDITAAFSRLPELCALPESDPLRIAEIRYAVLRILLCVCRRYAVPAEGASALDRVGDARIRQIIARIDATPEAELSLPALAAELEITPCHLAHEFRRVTGTTFVSYLNLMRCEKAKRLLRETTLPIAAVAARCGFRESYYFSRKFREYTDMLPSEYRKG